jgi:hypothetical protein
MQRFNFLVEDGFRDADRTVRDGLRQTAASRPQAISVSAHQRVTVAIQKFLY